MDIDRERDYAECRAYDCGLADYGRGRRLCASPYDAPGLMMCWERGWLDAAMQALAKASEYLSAKS